MSVLRSRSSLTNNKVFLLSGLSGDIRKDLAKKISLLGGIYFDIEVHTLFRLPDKSAYLKIIVLISQSKHMFRPPTFQASAGFQAFTS